MITLAPERAWVRLLRPAAGAALDTTVSDPELVGAVIARAGVPAASWAVELGRHLAAHVLPETAVAAPQLAGMEAIALWAVLAVCGEPEPPAGLVVEGVGAIQDSVAHDATLEDMLSGVRRAHVLIVERFFDFCADHLEPADAVKAQRQLTADLFAGIELVTLTVCEKFDVLQKRWRGSTPGAIGETVRALIAGQPVNEKTVTRRLGYDLSLHHVALLLSSESPRPGDELERLAAELLEESGCSSWLLVPIGRNRLWAWGGRVSGDPGEVLGAVPAHIQVACGLPGSGPAGFRRSHLLAVKAEGISLLGGTSGGTIARFHDLEVAGLMMQDPEGLSEFLARELGALAADDPSTDALRETVKCYLETDRSVARSAELLHIAKNTVLYRVRKAADLLGRPVHQDKMRLQLALYLSETLGRPPAD
jgi:hypothetical protein